MKIFHTETKNLCKKLFDLERQGRYEEALAEVEEVWRDKTGLPDVDESESHTAAELILRCGSLIGFLGHNKQIPKAQEKSKDLLTEARKRFLEIYDSEKIAECENYLALAYWRTGEINEAEAFIEESLSRNLENSNFIRLYSYIIKCLIMLSAHKCDEIVNYLTKLEKVFLTFGDAGLKGDFYNYLGVSFEILGDIDKAVKFLESARVYQQKANHKSYLGAIDNNIALLYKTDGNFAKAHEAIDRAIKTFKQIKDRTREGFSFDTKAQIYSAGEKYAEALNTIEAAIKILRRSENAGYLTATYLTKTKILINLDYISDATLCLYEAVHIAKTQISDEAAVKLTKEFEITLREKFARKTSQTSPSNYPEVAKDNAAKDDLELVLPASIAQYKEIQAVQIRNKHLEYAGLKKGSFAIVADIKVKKGDLAAITDLETDAVNCGFYDEDFGIVCLESENSAPLLFDEKNIKILGKIVGVGMPETSSGNKIIVKSLIK